MYCESTSDVQKTVAWARKNGVRIFGRSGGHSYGGYSTTSSGVVLDVSRMNFVQPHGGGTALIGAGAQLIDIYAKLNNRASDDPRRLLPDASASPGSRSAADTAGRDASTGSPPTTSRS